MGEDQQNIFEDELVADATPADFPQHTTVPLAATESVAGADNSSSSCVVITETESNCKKTDPPATAAVAEIIKDCTPTKKCLACALKDAEAEGEIPEYFSVLLEGMDAWGDSGYSLDSRPDWFDEAKFHRGQQFSHDYFFGLMLAEMLSLLVLFSFRDSLQPLIFTGNSDTPYKAFRRYLSTVSRVRSWYDGDPWAADSAARRNLRVVRAMHTAVRRRLNATPTPASREFTLDGRGEPLWSTLLADIQADFRSSCPFGASNLVNSRSCDRRLFVNQADMGFTQFGFVGLMLTYPERFGAAGASEADLEGFAHLWRTYGHLLGIDDRYNFCAGSLAEVRQRSKYILQTCVRPKLRDVTADWEHMSRCMVEGISYYVTGISFETSLYYLTRLLDVESPRLWAAMTAWQRFMFYVMWFVMCFVLRLPGSGAFHNWLLKLSIKKAETASPVRLAKLESRHYRYQDCKPTVCTRL